MNESEILSIHGIDQEGRGVARAATGKTVFVIGALPLETVRARVVERKKHFDVAQTETVIKQAHTRVVPRCQHFGDCGGCSLQHADFSAQVAFKQRVFEEQLWRIGKVQPENVLPPLYGEPWHYRHRTRLRVQINERGRAVLGYLSRRSKRVVPIEMCPILVRPLSGSLKVIRSAVQIVQQRYPQAKLEAVELYHSDDVAAIHFLTQKRLPEQVMAAVSGCLNEPNHALFWQVWQQQHPSAPQAYTSPNTRSLAYRLPEFGLTMPYQPSDFTQVNQLLNPIMVARAVRYLDLKPNETVADLFCGLGNFSLPLARSGARVIGVEGLASLTQRVQQNAAANGMHNVEFITDNLFNAQPETLKKWGKIDKILLDPPRAGALAVVQSLCANHLPRKIVYVSCNPATFARDAAVLVQKGYRFSAAGVMNLFAQTAHVEAMGVFECD